MQNRLKAQVSLLHEQIRDKKNRLKFFNFYSIFLSLILNFNPFYEHKNTTRPISL